MDLVGTLNLASSGCLATFFFFFFFRPYDARLLSVRGMNVGRTDSDWSLYWISMYDVILSHINCRNNREREREREEAEGGDDSHKPSIFGESIVGMRKPCSLLTSLLNSVEG